MRAGLLYILIVWQYTCGQTFLVVSVSTSVCLVGLESFEVSDMAAVFTSGLKVNISELFFFFFWMNCSAPSTNTLKSTNWVKHCMHALHTSSILKLPCWFPPIKAGSLGDTQQIFVCTDSKWGEAQIVFIKAGQNSPGPRAEADEEKPSVSKDEWNKSWGRCGQPSGFW